MYPEEVKNFISGEYSEEDKIFVANWLKEEPAREKELKELNALWKKTGSLQLLEGNDIEAAWHTVSAKIGAKYRRDSAAKINYLNAHKKRASTGRMLLFKVAAVLFLVFGLFSIYKYKIAASSDASTAIISLNHTLHAGLGEKVQYQLKDGSVIMLNAGSEIKYGDSYGKKNRTLYLSGEAYFKVNNENQAFPFIVKTGKARIRDLSTAFNITAYKGTGNTSVVVADGQVEVSSLKDSIKAIHSVLVKEGYGVKVEGPKAQLALEKADLDYSLGWLNNELAFKNNTFKDIAQKLERYYNIRIIVKGAALNRKKLTASFKNEKMRRVLDIVALSLNAEYKIVGNRVTFQKAHQH